MVVLAGVLAIACDGEPLVPPGVPAVTATPSKTATPEATATATRTATPTNVPATATPTSPPPPPPTATPEPYVPPPPPTRPETGYWIDVDVSNYVVSLMHDSTVLQVIAPVGVGEQIDTGAYLSTATGLYYVYSLNDALVYDAPYDTYISHWVGFDPSLDNGFHSFLKNEDGEVVDASTGRVSNGCIRTGGAEDIYAFAYIGMPVWVRY
jgi:hypothetical protein